MIKKLALSLIAAAAVCLPSCNSNKSSGTDGEDAGMGRFVTLTSNTDDGSSFNYYNVNNQSFTLTSSRKIPNAAIKVGERLLVAYTCNWGSADKSGSIDLLAYQQIINGTLEVGSSVQLSTPQYAVYPTQSGPWLDIEARVSVVNQPKTYKVVMDENTIDSDWPTVYLVFESDKEAEGTYKDVYASFDMSSIWNNSKYNGYTLKAVVTAYTGSSSTWNFAKPNAQTITPAQ